MATESGSLLSAGDFNLHVNDVRDTTATRFLQLIESFNLKQHVCEPTHRNGQILDLLITRADESIASAVNVTDLCLSTWLFAAVCLCLRPLLEERKFSIVNLNPLISLCSVQISQMLFSKTLSVMTQMSLLPSRNTTLS